MVCEKCGHEFFEGRNCPECGALAIFVKEDEYQERKQEWEEENASKEAAKKKLNIHINPAIIKKAVILVAVVCVIATAIFIIGGIIKKFIEQSRYVVVYEKGGVFDDFTEDEAAYSADGNFVYKDEFDKSNVEGEIISACVSTDGKYGALVSRVGTEVAEYLLYELNGGSKQVYRSFGVLNIIEVTGDGRIYYEEAELGAYDVVLGASIYVYDGEKSKLVADNIGDFEYCENEDEFIFYDSDLQAYLYDDGVTQPLSEDEEGREYARCKTGAMYYVSSGGELYVHGKKVVIDSGIYTGSLSVIPNSDKVTYIKDGALYCYGKSMKAPIVLVSEYNIYGVRARVVEKHDKIYCAYNGKLIITNKKGDILSEESGVDGVYLRY